ncbi:MAG: DUF3748 domain-containing protein [Prolixibacteraceae bacterium]|jgi:hypothetical protein
MKYNLLMGLLVLGDCSSSETYLEEIQLTDDSLTNHVLDNNDNFSPDGKWLVYDTRTDAGGIGGNSSIERVNVDTKEITTLFHIQDNQIWGPGAGAASYHPIENKVIFIHGLSNCTEKNPYLFWRRTGVIVDDSQPNVPIFMDSRDVTVPFTPGALRGGTHRHEYRRDGKWIGFTYNDFLMKELENKTGVKWNLRTIGVSNQQHTISVDKDEAGENVQGTWYSAVVVRVVPDPEPGSNEISNAASDSWIGTGGYPKPDGSMQVARAFLGTVRDKKGKPVDELFVVDIPDSLDIPGEYGPLEGTETTFPMPPKGTVQRRLTHTADTQYPGCGGVVRTSFDGKYISYQAKDANGVQQIFLIAPEGGTLTQVTEHTSGVQSGVRWSPDNKSVIYVCDNSIVLCEVSDRPFERRYRRLTAKTADAPSNIVWSHDGKTIAFNRAIPTGNGEEKMNQIFIVKLDQGK